MNLAEQRDGRKEELFESIRNRGLFWSYDRSIRYEPRYDDLLIETVLKYGEFEELEQIFDFYETKKIRGLWERVMKHDRRFVRTNLLLARVFFGLDLQAGELMEVESGRARRIRMLAS